MATITIQNVSTANVYIADMYKNLAPGDSISTDRKESDLSRMAGLQAAIASGQVAVTVTYGANEKASGLVSEVEPAAVQNTDALSTPIVLRKALTAGVGGSADDVTVFALNSLPYNKLRVMDAYLICSAGSGAGEKVGLYTQTAAGGTLLAEVNATAAGRNTQTSAVTATTIITNGASVGLFAHRSTNVIGGELFITLRPEV